MAEGRAPWPRAQTLKKTCRSQNECARSVVWNASRAVWPNVGLSDDRCFCELGTATAPACRAQGHAAAGVPPVAPKVRALRRGVAGRVTSKGCPNVPEQVRVLFTLYCARGA